MVNCEYLNCKKVAYYNKPGKKQAKFCSEHKEDDMIDVKNKTCEYIDKDGNRCKIKPIYNKPGEKNRKFCFDHKEDDMIDIAHKTCEYVDKDGNRCKIRPSYNKLGEKTGKFCFNHKEDNMINILSKTCQFIDDKGIRCKTQPSYNKFGEKRGMYCFNHKEDDMIDVVNPKCRFIDKDGKQCTIRPTFNKFGEKRGIFCVQHKENDMIDVYNKICQFIDKDGNQCTIQSSYNKPGETLPMYCSKHKKDDMINIKSIKCKSNNLGIQCMTLGNKYYDYYCVHCFTNLFPTDPRTLTARKKNKEIAVKNFLYNNGFSDFLHDKPLYVGEGDCTRKRRVDLHKIFIHLYKDINYLFCIGVDENQHKFYNKEDEEQRYHDLYRHGYIMIYIRYNPDKYKDKNGKNKNPRFENRMTVLIEEIEKTIKGIKKGEYTDELLYVKYLYYDE